MLVAVLGQPAWATVLGCLVTEFPSVAFLAGPGLTHPPTARPVVTDTMDTGTIFITVLAMLVWVCTDVAGCAFETFKAVTVAIPLYAITAISPAIAWTGKSPWAWHAVWTKEPFAASRFRDGLIAVPGAPLLQDIQALWIMDVNTFLWRECWFHFLAARWANAVVEGLTVHTRAHHNLMLLFIASVRQNRND